MKRKIARLCVALSLSLAPLAGLHAQEFVPPTPSDPSNAAPVGSLPGAFPLGVTGANVNIAPVAGSVLGGTGSNDLKVSFPASGPIKWTSSRYNEGDVAFNLSPFAPNDPSYYPPNSFGEYKPLADGQPYANTVLGWRANVSAGAFLATVRHNGVNNNDTINGSPVGTTHGVAYFNAAFGQGWGYNMRDGVLGNGGNGAADMQMGIAGYSGASDGEASFNVATAFFPYSQGWQGAWVNGQADGPGTFVANSPGLDPAAVLNWSGSVATVTLPGVNSANDGMLFVAPTSDSNATDIAAATPVGGGWKVAIREDQNDDLSGSSLLAAPFQFLYVPYDAKNLVGGHINGSNGSAIKSVGDASYDLTRNSAGEYRLSVYGANGVTKKVENDGMLVLSVAGTVPTNSSLPDRTFLSYQYDPVSGDFIIQSRELAAISSPNSQNQFGDDLALRDSNFYFAWVDFANPLSLASGPAIPGDFDDDGFVDGDDLATWRTNFGMSGGTKATGDANLDGTIDGADFLLWQQQFSPAGSTLASTNVPEPAVGAMLLVAGAFFSRVRNRRPS